MFSGITNQDLKCIANFTSIATLALFSYEALAMDDDIITTLTSLTSLMHLYLPHKVTDDAVQRIFIQPSPSPSPSPLSQTHPPSLAVSPPRLQALLLMTCDDLTDVGYKDIATITSLTELDLMGCVQITEEGLYPLLSLPKLTKLRLREIFIFNDKVIESLCERLSSIADLTLENMDEVTDSGFLHFSRLTSLVTLTLKDAVLITGIFTFSFSFSFLFFFSLFFLFLFLVLPFYFSLLFFFSFSSLILFSFFFFILSHIINSFHADLKPLSVLPSLMSLHLKGFTNLGDEGMKCICSLHKTLVTLELERCSGLSPDSMQHALSPLHNLRTLSLRGNNHINDESLRFVSLLPSLTGLVLSDCNGVTDSVAEVLAGHTSLTSLFLRSCGVITDTFLRRIGTSLPSLTELHLGKCSGVTDQGLQYLSTLTALRHIDLWECPGVSAEGVEYLSSLGLNVEV